MLYLSWKSTLVDDLEKIVKKHKALDYPCTFECERLCRNTGTMQLHHAKAVLEQSRTHGDENNIGVSAAMSLMSTTLAGFALITSVMPDCKKDWVTYLGTIVSVLIVFLLAFIIYHVREMLVIPHRRVAYYYSLICDELNRRGE